MLTVPGIPGLPNIMVEMKAVVFSIPMFSSIFDHFDSHHHQSHINNNWRPIIGFELKWDHGQYNINRAWPSHKISSSWPIKILFLKSCWGSRLTLADLGITDGVSKNISDHKWCQEDCITGGIMQNRQQQMSTIQTFKSKKKDKKLCYSSRFRAWCSGLSFNLLYNTNVLVVRRNSKFAVVMLSNLCQ